MLKATFTLPEPPQFGQGSAGKAQICSAQHQQGGGFGGWGGSLQAGARVSGSLIHPHVWHLGWEDSVRAGSWGSSGISFYIWSPNVVCLVCGFRVTRFLIGWFRAPMRVSEREPGQAERSLSIPSTSFSSLRQSQGSPWIQEMRRQNLPSAGRATRVGKSMWDWEGCCSHSGRINGNDNTLLPTGLFWRL